MRTGIASILTAAAAALLLVACGDDSGGDGTDARIDARIDAATIDAPDIDGPPIDAAVDAPTDAAVDAATDATPTASEWILFARQAADGTGLTLPIMGATVTYIKPVGGNPTNDPAGFTIQASQTGPALMVAVDPATLSPVPVVGDVVSFTITTKTTVAMQPRATAISGFTRDSQGANVGALAQSVSAATDLVTALDSYDSEIIDVSGTIAGTFGSAGSGFEQAQITTTGMPTPSGNFVLRVPTALRDANDMAMGCNFTLDNTPVHRFNANAQLSAFVSADFMLTNCPAPVVMAAVALSATSVRVTFSRNIAPGSVNANGSQFMIDNGLTVLTASVSGRNVTLTTSPQVGGSMYTVTVTNTVTDLQGTMLGTPNTAMFTGFVTPAVVRINEINANIGTGCDLIELRVISGGNMGNFKIQERTGVVGDMELNFTFTNFNVLTNDLIVVHLNGGSTTCNPGNPQSTNETTSIIGQPRAAFARNYDTAYDWHVSDAGLVATDNVITLYDAAGVIMDCVLIDDDNLPTVPMPSNVAAASETQAAACAAASQWRNNGGGTPAGGYVDEDFRLNSVRDSNGTSTMFDSGVTLQRIDDTDENEMADWNASPGVTLTFGALNAGQSAL